MPELDQAQQVPAIVPLEFWTDHEPADDKGTLREVHWVKYAKKGSNGATNIEKVHRLERYDMAAWSVVRPYYEAWKQGQEEPVEGTPLSAWPGVTKGQVEHLKSIHIRSVEDLAGSTDGDLDRMGMGARSLRDKARAFVKAKEGQAVIAEELHSRDQQIAQLMADNEEMKATIAQLSKSLPKREKPRDVAK